MFRLPPADDGKSFRKPNDQEIEYYRLFVFDHSPDRPTHHIANWKRGLSIDSWKDRQLQVCAGNGHNDRTIGSCQFFILPIC